MPRDIESAAADLQNVFLYNLDDLAKIAETNRSARLAEVARCRVMLAERADGLWVQLRRSFDAPAEARTQADGSNPAAGHATAP
jgi:glutamyl-tRNA reductase